MVAVCIAQIFELKNRLESDSLQEEEILSILSDLDNISVDKTCLAKTLIGNTVSKYKQHSNLQVAKHSRTLVKKWRSVVLQTLSSEKENTPQFAASQSTQEDSAHKDAELKFMTVSLQTPKSDTRNPSDHGSHASTFMSSRHNTFKFQGPFCSSLKRNRAREILFQAFMEGVTQDDQDKIEESRAAHLVASIEEALWEHHSVIHSNIKNYQAQLRSIKCNLSDKKNPEFNLRIYNGLITPNRLTTLLSTEMASDAKKQERTETKRSALEACQSDWDLRNIKRAEGQFPCGKCKSSKTTYFQLQTRSSDEPMTTFVSCLECGNRWKF